MKEIEIIHNTSIEFTLFKAFARFIIYRKFKIKTQGPNFVVGLNQLLDLNLADNTLRNYLSKVENDELVFKLSVDKYEEFCERFLKEFYSMNLANQEKYQPLHSSFCQWKSSLDQKHGLSQKNTSGSTDSSITVGAIPQTNLQSSIILNRHAADNFEAYNRIHLRTTQEVDVYAALRILSNTKLNRKHLSTLENNYFILLLEALQRRISNEGGHYSSSDDSRVKDSFEKLLYGSWTTLEIRGDKVINKSISFQGPATYTDFGVSCFAIYRQSVEHKYASTCYFHVYDEWLVIVEKQDIELDKDILEIMAFPFYESENPRLGHKVIFNTRTFELNVHLILLKNEENEENEDQITEDFYREFDVSSNLFDDLDRAYLKIPQRLEGHSPLRNIPMSVYMAIPFFEPKHFDFHVHLDD